MVGRIYVDNILMALTKRFHSELIDISFYGRSVSVDFDIADHFHQGMDTFQKHGYNKQTEEDKLWNFKYLNGTVMTFFEAKYFIDKDEKMYRMSKGRYMFKK